MSERAGSRWRRRRSGTRPTATTIGVSSSFAAVISGERPTAATTTWMGPPWAAAVTALRTDDPSTATSIRPSATNPRPGGRTTTWDGGLDLNVSACARNVSECVISAAPPAVASDEISGTARSCSNETSSTMRTRVRTGAAADAGPVPRSIAQPASAAARRSRARRRVTTGPERAPARAGPRRRGR